MNRYVLYILVSIAGILIPIIGLLYGLWDMNQPKTGPVGDGTKAGPTPIQLSVIIGAMLSGVLNLFVAIKRYSDHRNSSKHDDKSE